MTAGHAITAAVSGDVFRYTPYHWAHEYLYVKGCFRARPGLSRSSQDIFSLILHRYGDYVECVSLKHVKCRWILDITYVFHAISAIHFDTVKTLVRFSPFIPERFTFAFVAGPASLADARI